MNDYRTLELFACTPETFAGSMLAAVVSRGPGRAVICVSLLGIGVGLVTWFTVGLLLLVPGAASLARRSGRPFLLVALPMVAFLSAMHGLTPPHPGPVVAIDALGANPGMVLALAFAYYLGREVLAADEGTEAMKSIARSTDL